MEEVSWRGGARGRLRGVGCAPNAPHWWQEDRAQSEERQQFLDQLGVFNQAYDVTINRFSCARARRVPSPAPIGAGERASLIFAAPRSCRPPIMGGHKLDLHALFNIVLEHQVGVFALSARDKRMLPAHAIAR